MKKLFKILSGKTLFFMTLGLAGFFCLIILSWYLYNLGSSIILINFINVLGNMLMLPMLFLVYPALLILSVIHCIHEKFRIKSWSFGSFLILLVSNPFFVGSIINS